MWRRIGRRQASASTSRISLQASASAGGTQGKRRQEVGRRGNMSSRRNSGQKATGGRSSGQHVVEAELRANQEGDGCVFERRSERRADGRRRNADGSRGRETDRRKMKRLQAGLRAEGDRR